MLGLELREEFKGRRLSGTMIELHNRKGTGALDKTASDFLKITYPSILGLDKSKEIQRAMIKGAVESLKSFGDRADPLRDIAQYIIERKK